MRKTRKNLLAKFLLSYILVLLFPVIIILVYYYPYSTEAAKEKEMEWNAHVTEQFMTSMDIFTRYVYDLPSELLQNRDMKLYMAMENDYQRIVIANEMRKYNATDAFIDNTLLYVKSIGYMFAKTGSVYSVQDFARRGVGYYYEAWPHEDMIMELDSLILPTVRPAENVIVPGNNRIRMLTFLLPIPLGGDHSPGAVMILVKEETIFRMMKSVSESYNGDFFIFDGQGKRLVASNAASYSESGDFNRLISRLGERGTGSGIHRIDGKSFIVSHTVSDKNDWHYVSLLPLTETLQDIRSLQRNTVVIFVLILLFEIIVIYISIRKNYHPIKRLVDFATDVFKQQEPKSMNEIDTIRYALDQLSSANSKLDERVKRTLPIMRENVLFELVSGHYKSWETFHGEAAEYGVFFNRPFITAAVISFETGEQDICKAMDYFRMEEERLPEGVRGYFFMSIYNQEFIFVCSHARDFSMKTYLAGVQRELSARTGTHSLIGIGTPESSSSPEGVHLSYLQAVRTSEYLRIRKQYAILVFDEIEVAQTGTVSYFAELLQSLEMSVLKNDAAVVESVMDRIIDYIGSDGMPPHMVRTVYLNTISVIFNGLQRFRQDDRNLLRLTDAAFQHRYTIEQMVGIMRESCGKLCDIIRGTLPPSRTASQEEILDIIEKKGMDHDFSLQLIADHFGMSLSGFSYHFKKTMGQNFKEYIDRLRIQKSIQLLRSSDEALDSIAGQVGYSSTSSFIRSFKKIAGTTPGQYRDTHR
ncbi:helix-turn-helix domain-containing protein [Paenibacillus alkaliterrae]|uniref:helix-turn-helix domain-containing protein n=1 Tax=Paenibacillus alkaliterrae TaxID=320909 RepID=UPI001F404251|nr:helix-turn-helix domain-containing protein [Paenibacillus alkaliterrae]MCF2939220.1 helix-turn-helix domain-containing protein [Paenibacillus alkaliterrae]